MAIDLSSLDNHLAAFVNTDKPKVKTPALLTARPWSVDMSGICPSCGKIMQQAISMNNPVLLCEADRICLPQPDNYVPPTQSVSRTTMFSGPDADIMNQLSYGAFFAEVPK